MIVVTGATGALNGTTVDHLLARLPAAEITVAVRHPERAAHLAGRGVTVREGGDYADPRLPDAFEGADQLLLVSSNDPGSDAVDLHRRAISAAVTAGVGRVLYTSHQGAAATSPFVPAVVHAATERLLAESGLPWTSLRNGFYAHSLGWLLGGWEETGVVAVPGEGPVSWTAREDVAEAAAVVLTSPVPHDGPLTLTAGAAPTFAEVAATLSELAGRPVERVVVPPEDWVAERVAAGQPEPVARFTLGIFQAAAQGFFAGVDPALARLLGREPRSAREVLATTVTAGRRAPG